MTEIPPAALLALTALLLIISSLLAVIPPNAPVGDEPREMRRSAPDLGFLNGGLIAGIVICLGAVWAVGARETEYGFATRFGSVHGAFSTYEVLSIFAGFILALIVSVVSTSGNALMLMLGYSIAVATSCIIQVPNDHEPLVTFLGHLLCGLVSVMIAAGVTRIVGGQRR